MVKPPKTPKGRAARPARPPPPASVEAKSRHPRVGEGVGEVGRTSWGTWAMLLPIVTILPYFLLLVHYHLPDPLPPRDATGRAQPSEYIVLDHVRSLENIGYRTVGTPQAVAGEEYVISQVREIDEHCNAGGVLKCEVWVQSGNGYHQFDIMHHKVLKVYWGVRNVILRISAHNPPSGQKRVEKDALLLNSHIDSTLPAPGAADDGVGVGVMLEVARVLVERNTPFDNSIIFLWNGAEGTIEFYAQLITETLQDGSHLYSTQHETAGSVRAVINLEAAGTAGGALLFQATSAEMIEAYSHVPHPRGTVAAADVFASGIIISDTDFGQFERYLNISGLDMAIVGHSYFYHTSQDVIRNIEKGSSQHFADNVMAVVDHLLAPASPLSTPKPLSPPSLVYFSMYDSFFTQWTMQQADSFYVALGGIATAISVFAVDKRNLKPFVMALLGTPTGPIVGVLAASLLAGLYSVIGRHQTWFSHEHLPLIVYTPVAYAANFSLQLLLSRSLSAPDRTLLERSHYYAQLLFATWYMLILQAYRVRSAYMFALLSGIMLVGVVGSESAVFADRVKVQGKISFFSGYVLPMTAFVFLGVEVFTATFDIFTPLTGRMGKDAPSELIIAIIASATGFIFFPLVIPLFHRLSRGAQRRVVLGLLGFTALTVVVVGGPWWSPYDSMHPKRVAFQYLYNHTSDELTCHVATMDLGAVSDIVPALHQRYGTEEPYKRTVLGTNDTDWDVLYPVSSYLITHRFPAQSSASFTWPAMILESEQISFADGVRRLSFRIDFTGLVSPTLAFEAEILDWSFDFDPPKSRERHHVKIAASAGSSVVELELAVRAEPGEDLNIYWTAIGEYRCHLSHPEERLMLHSFADLAQMIPASGHLIDPEAPTSKLLIDMGEWAEDRWKGKLDIVKYAAVTGVITV